MINQPTNKVHLISLDMGYGHQRAAYPLVEISKEGIVPANNYPNITLSEKKYWQKSREIYEKISYFKRVPLLGEAVFGVMDYFQKIDDFYPRRNLSSQTLQQRNFMRQIKSGLGKDLIDYLNQDPLPMITTFFVAAYFAEYHGYQGDIYCVLCDADVSRAWAMPNAKKSRVKYLVPTKITQERLLMYGVRPEMIIYTGFPLPLENIGNPEREITQHDLAVRLAQLDPEKNYRRLYGDLLKSHLPASPTSPVRPTTITFAVGGAGAQRQLGVEIITKLKPAILADRIAMNLVAGSREDVYEFFQSEIIKLNLQDSPNIRLIYHPNKAEYFRLFNEALRGTDILWTKPSELSFYTALGLPIIMAEPVGAQEYKNRDWLLSIGAAHNSLNPTAVDEWLFDWLVDGRLARSAMNAYLNAPALGTYNIKKLFFDDNQE